MRVSLQQSQIVSEHSNTSKNMFFRPGGGGGAAAAAVRSILVRHFSRSRAKDVRRINPKVPKEEAKEISSNIYDIIKAQGPLTVSNAWDHVKDGGVNGLTSKTHMKIMLKWMWGKQMLKLFCTKIGSNKKFMYTTLPEDPKTVAQGSSAAATPLASEPPKLGKKKTKMLAIKNKKLLEAQARQS